MLKSELDTSLKATNIKEYSFILDTPRHNAIHLKFSTLKSFIYIEKPTSTKI